mmetsp:Transcript_29620/g.26214  ORF Transcript_29620/g.26214 Transcript_29620/m.26214 type:complete len:141 (+) Transcript_29620:19-441(+)
MFDLQHDLQDQSLDEVTQTKAQTTKEREFGLNIGSYSIITTDNPRINFSYFQKLGKTKHSYLGYSKNVMSSKDYMRNTSNLLKKFSTRTKNMKSSSMPQLPPAKSDRIQNMKETKNSFNSRISTSSLYLTKESKMSSKCT